MNFVLYTEIKSDIISVIHKSRIITVSHILPFTFKCLLNITQLDFRQTIHLNLNGRITMCLDT